ncbi:phosphomannomutase/phosphoglucomutase [Bdellovibrio sp. SKB1291214]|uniref:phosphomannomutase/phosphoglucomutase n=1 Tax=Bdellovibrio sp. SKB1291214 TaxID=1732569 RepID=UPI000B519473|nr:phosphomannomutase/phosphoglucomutase [Bdellovibrio sp. SKB1291214]UYL10541.1 phosphomannomutase/phosphoglucomutase [Bdellovibrio sp. SKB1291214]
MYQPVIFREYDIRGVYNGQFDDNFAYLLARAFVVHMKNVKNISNPTLTIGHDARVSSPAIVKSMEKGFVDSGAKVIHLGLVTSPVCYFSTFTMKVDGAVQVTGSHNPPEFNGFKISLGKTTIFGEEIQELRKIIEKGEYIDGKGSVESFDIRPSYYEHYKKEFGQMKNVKVVLDCGNGAGGSVVRGLYEACGLTPTILFEEPDGAFPNHHPDPTVEKNLVALAAQVKKEGAVCGIGFDGDADRIGVVDHTGRMVYGDELMTIVSRAILETNKGAKIVGDVKCSDRLYHDIAKHGGQPIMWKTGHSLIKEKIKVEKAPFGGEMSGHIFFADRNFGYDDAPYAGLRLVEILAKTGKNIPELLAGLPPAFNTPEIRIDTTEEKKVLIVEKMKEAFKGGPDADYKVDLTDGIRLSFEDGWALCRSSNTQPVLVVRYEATTAEGMKRIQDRVEAVVNKYL